MEFSFEISSEAPLLIVRHSGVVVKQDVQSYIEAMLELEGREDCLFQLNDFSGLQGIDLDFSKVWSLTRQAKLLYPDSRLPVRCAFYAPTDIVFGFARMYSTMMEGVPGVTFEAVRCIHEAWEWFGIPEPKSWDAENGSVA